MKTVLFFFGFLLAVTPAVLLAKKPSPEEQGRPTIQQVYDNCKDAVKAAESDMSAFTNSYCASIIAGFWDGYLAVIEKGSVINQKEDECREARLKTYNFWRNHKCIPEAWTKLGIPLELKIAQETVHYVDKELEKYQKGILPDKHTLWTAEAYLAERHEFAGGLLQSALHCEALGGGDSEYAKNINYPSLETLYNHCKKDLAASDKDPKAFLESYCAGYFGSAFLGILIPSWIIPTESAKACSENAFAKELSDALQEQSCEDDSLTQEWKEAGKAFKKMEKSKKQVSPYLTLERIYAETLVKWVENHPELLKNQEFQKKFTSFRFFSQLACGNKKRK